MFSSQPHLTAALSAARIDDLHRAAEQHRLARTPGWRRPRRIARRTRVTAGRPATLPAGAS